MKKSPAEIRWEGHRKHVRHNLSFRPEYSELLTRISKERKITLREVLEEALEVAFGDFKKEEL